MESVKKRWPWRFGLTSLFLVVVVVSVPLAWKAKENQARKDRLLALVAEASVSPHVTYGRERDIYLALQRNLTFTFTEVPLQEVVNELEKLTGVPIIVDTRALDHVGLGFDLPVTASAQDETLDSALHRVLRELELAFTVRDGVLQITTPERMKSSRSRVRVYNVAHLLDSEGDATRLASVLHNALMQSDDYDSRTEYIGAHEHLLVVCANPGGHYQLAKTLEMLKAGLRP